MNILGLTGYKQAGKTTLAGVAVVDFGFQRIGFADELKEMVEKMWPAFTFAHIWGDRKEEVLEEYGKTAREVLQHVGTDMFRAYDPDVWVRCMRRRIHAYLMRMGNSARPIIIDDIRFDNEAALIRELGGQVWEVVRKDPQSKKRRKKDIHPSELGLLASSVDMVILNAFGMEEYLEMCRRKVKEFVDGQT